MTVTAKKISSYALISSITAAANASGSSCGKLCPARGITR
jgi:hypothetical protein